MATGTLGLTIEAEPVYDAVDLLGRAHQALARRHGERFRALEREIEALADAELGLGDPHDLGDGHFIFAAPARLTALIAKARALGVI